MGRLALILCALTMTSTAWAYPFAYQCSNSSNPITLQVAVASKDMISISRFKSGKFEELKVWKANYQTIETLEFLYPKQNIYIRASKDMMVRGKRLVAFSYDKTMPDFQCVRKY